MAEIDIPKPKFKTDLSFMFGEYIRPNESGQDAYVGFFKDVVTGENVMRVVDNPMVNIYITKERFRMHGFKKEWAPKTELDEYTTRYCDRAETIENILSGNGRPWYGKKFFKPLRKLMSSQYVYGADIDFGVRWKYRTECQNGGRKPDGYNVGHLDIETGVNGIDPSLVGQILLMTFISHDGKTFTGVLRDFLIGTNTGKTFEDPEKNKQAREQLSQAKVQDIHNLWNSKVEKEVYNSLNKKTKSLYDKSPKLDITVKVFDEEIELIRWVFDNIHACRPDFITIWNMDYDLPFILDRIQFRGVNPTDILCSPDIPEKYRFLNYRKDPGKKGDHITDRWSVLHLTDHTHYLDSMNLYARLRKASTKEPSYKLDAIASKELGAGKLEFGSNDHRTMQLNHQVEYTVYNIVDVLLLRLLDLKNHDTNSMMILLSDSLIEDYSKQSVQLKNTFFCYLDELKGVPCSVGEPLGLPWDKYMTNKGGQVLDPANTRGTGVSILVDTDIITYVHKLVCDIDVCGVPVQQCAVYKTLLIAGTL